MVRYAHGLAAHLGRVRVRVRVRVRARVRARLKAWGGWSVGSPPG